MERRGAQGAETAAHAAWEAGGVPTRTAKEESHTRQVFAHAHAGEDRQFFGSAGGAGSSPRDECKGLLAGVAEWCRAAGRVLEKLKADRN